jgi:ATP-binding cassette subfamily B protein
MKFYPQHDQMDCGPACIKMVANHFGKNLSLDYLREISYISSDGVSLLNLKNAFTKLHFETFVAQTTIEELITICPTPCILHWKNEHFVVLYKVKCRKSLFTRNQRKFVFHIADPSHGFVKLDEQSFKSYWLNEGNAQGTTLLLEPQQGFHELEENEKPVSYNFLYKHLLPFKQHIFQLFIGVLLSSLISLILPFLTQLLIDYGVNEKNNNIISVILLSQLFLFFGNTMIGILQNWLLLHVSTRISLSIMSDFLAKLMKLSLSFFDTKSVGDISQRINDQNRIESFLTGVSLNSLFSIINIITFSIVLSIYSLKIVMLFTLFSALGVFWVLAFRAKRERINYKNFAQNKENLNKLYELIIGMQEIKLYGNEVYKRWEWERLQIKSFDLNIKSLTLEQYQKTGFLFLSQLKNIVISFFVAQSVIRGELSLGAMLSISYIIGQTNGPLEQLIAFVKAGQDAKISFRRMQEIHNKSDEDHDYNLALTKDKKENNESFVNKDIVLTNMSFQYDGPNSPWVLDNINLIIPKGKITAIVGTSGSGKTTLMKLLLGYYNPVEGSIHVGNNTLKQQKPSEWRAQCGTVMQEGYIFTDSIARNIALDGENIDENRLKLAVKTANLTEFVEALPLSYNTKIGNGGIGLSGGQRQRILIARAVYKNPSYLFFDEATSALDANNERAIVENLNLFFVNKTVLIIAHRLSTVKNADHIIVLDKGKIVEYGTHNQLCYSKQHYYRLVKNQLELAS